LLALIGVVGLATGAEAGRDYQTMNVVRTPLKLELPTAWHVVAPSRGLTFLAFAPDRTTYLGIAPWGPATGWSFAAFARRAVEEQRQYYGTKDPDAKLRHRHRALPIGPTEQIIVRFRVRESRGAPVQQLDAVTYWFLSGGRAYNLSCIIPTSKLGAYFPVCEHAVRSLRARSV
jgi:hypothetical protein